MQGAEMGRPKVFYEGLMTRKEVASHLVNTCDAFDGYQPYMFGSFLSGVGSDIDILIIGPAGYRLSILKVEIESAGRELPLDVLYMDCTEAEETNFVIKEKCVALRELIL